MSDIPPEDPTYLSLVAALTLVCQKYEYSSGNRVRWMPDCEGGLSIEIGPPAYLTVFRFDENGKGKEITFRDGEKVIVEELP